MSRAKASSDTYARFYAIVRRIPRGRVSTYGEVARLAGLPGRARQVGYAMHAIPEDARIPWQRVINARGEVSPRAEPGMDRVQRQLLEQEGVEFDRRGRVDLARFGWRPRRAAPRSASSPKRAGKRSGEKGSRAPC